MPRGRTPSFSTSKQVLLTSSTPVLQKRIPVIRYTLAYGGTHGIEEKVGHFARVRPTTGRDYNKLHVPFSKYNTAIDTRTKFEQIPARDTVFPFLLFLILFFSTFSSLSTFPFSFVVFLGVIYNDSLRFRTSPLVLRLESVLTTDTTDI